MSLTATTGSTNPFIASSSSAAAHPSCLPFSAIKHCDCDRRPHTAKLVLRKQETVLDLSTLRTLKFPKDFRSTPPQSSHAPSHSFHLVFEPFASTGYALVTVTSKQPCADAHFPIFIIEVQVRIDPTQSLVVTKRVQHHFSPEYPTVVIDRLRSPVDMFEDFDAGRTVTISVSIKRSSLSVDSVMEHALKRVHELRLQQELTDVVLKSKEGEGIPAHRIILASRSILLLFIALYCVFR